MTGDNGVACHQPVAGDSLSQFWLKHCFEAFRLIDQVHHPCIGACVETVNAWLAVEDL